MSTSQNQMTPSPPPGPPPMGPPPSPMAPPPTRFLLPIHPGNVGMVVGFKGATIKGINGQHQGWAHAHLEQPNAQNGQTQPCFVIVGHPVHVAAIAVAITEIAMVAKHRHMRQGSQSSHSHTMLTMGDFILKSAPRNDKPRTRTPEFEANNAEFPMISTN
jgi:hypothetical protein